MLKIVKWVILGLIGLVIGFFLLVPAISPFRYKSYIYATTYPAACWTDDGKQIIYLEHREIRRGTFPKVYASKTYLMIMDANGKNKKVVGLEPDYTNEQKDKLKSGRLSENEIKEIVNKSNEFYQKHLSKSEITRLKQRNEKTNTDLEIRYKKDLPEKWKNLSYTRYLGISSDSKYLLILDSKIHGLVKIDLDGKRKTLEKSTYQKKCYLFLPPWWKV
ncbi:MAG: hypothetical protein A2474_06990 [Elusimicrobia bacterium RIFOXYC2_FULL_34_12]|nr:MAG: hypothetical protein A2474_06990 [Elusimicrobia bacterium RIFOXYC2_FULL_34_12]